MKKTILALMSLLVLLMTACAGTSQTSVSAASDGGGLPEIAAYDDAAFEALPDVITAE